MKRFALKDYAATALIFFAVIVLTTLIVSAHISESLAANKPLQFSAIQGVLGIIIVLAIMGCAVSGYIHHQLESHCHASEKKAYVRTTKDSAGRNRVFSFSVITELHRISCSIHLLQPDKPLTLEEIIAAQQQYDRQNPEDPFGYTPEEIRDGLEFLVEQGLATEVPLDLKENMRQIKYRGPVKLAVDGSYSTPYQLDEREREMAVYPKDTHPTIHAYHQLAETRKERFLKDASKYLLTIGQELERSGFRPAAVASHPAGIAVSGDISAEYHHPESDRSIYVNISQCSVNILGEAAPIGTCPINETYTTRKDGITILGRWREIPPAGTRGDPASWRSRREGPNTWFDANLNSRELAAQIIRLADVTPVPAQLHEWVQASFFDLAAVAPPPHHSAAVDFCGKAGAK